MGVNQFLGQLVHIAETPEGIQNLRKIILHLALIGKFATFTENSNAESLLEKIKIHKDDLVKDGKLRRNKFLFSNNQAFEPLTIPKHWKWASLGDLAYFLADGSHNPPSKVNNGIPMLSGQNILDGELNYDASRYVSIEAYEKEIKRTPIEAGDVLLSIVGTIGRSCVVPEEYPAFCLQRSVAQIKSKMNSSYLSFVLRSPYSLNFYKENAKGTAQKGIYLNKLALLPVPVPPLEEQAQIVKKVNDLMSLCDQLEQKIIAKRKLQNKLRQTAFHAVTSANNSFEIQKNFKYLIENFKYFFSYSEDLVELRNLILNLAVKGQLVLQHPDNSSADIWLKQIIAVKQRLGKEQKKGKQTIFSSISESEYPFKLPTGWVFARLGQITSKIGSGSTPRGGAQAYVKEGVPFLRSQNIHNDGLKLNDVVFISLETHERMASTTVQANDLLLNITGASLGRCAMVPENFKEANVSQHVTIIRAIDPEIKEYLHLCMLSPYIQELIWERQVGMAREGLSKRVLEQFEIPIPPIEEQQRIVKKVENLLSYCEDFEDKLNKINLTIEKLTVSFVEKVTGLQNLKDRPLKAPQTELYAILEVGSTKPNIDDDACLTKLIMKEGGAINARELWKLSGEEIDVFYSQLKKEILFGWIKEPSIAEMLVKD